MYLDILMVTKKGTFMLNEKQTNKQKKTTIGNYKISANLLNYMWCT